MTTEVPGYVTKTDLVAVLIRELLITGELRPGEQLRQRDLAHSTLLLSLMRLLWASVHGGPRVSRTHAESARQHDEILAALAEGDAGTASARTYQHIMGADPVKEESG